MGGDNGSGEQRLGRYQLDHLIRRDALGEVWLARVITITPDWQPAVILRRFSPEVLDSEPVAELIREELEHTLLLCRVNIPMTHETSEEGEPVLVTQPTWGPTLEQTVAHLHAQGATLSDEAQLFVAHSIAWSLCHAHERHLRASDAEVPQLAHGLVSSREVRLDADGEVRLGGFGLGALARALCDGAPMHRPTDTGDLLALALVMHEMSSGEQLLPPADAHLWRELDRGWLPAELQPERAPTGPLEPMISRLLSTSGLVASAHRLVEELKPFDTADNRARLMEELRPLIDASISLRHDMQHEIPA